MSSDIVTDNTVDNDYVSRSGQKDGPVPVQSDETLVEDGLGQDADSDAALARDDKEAIDESNIVEGKTRGAKPAEGYKEPGDDEGLPSDDGTSEGAQ